MAGKRPAQPIRNIGIIAHIDAGKTTVSERILYYSHKEHRMGNVDDGNTVLDYLEEERRRGITITAAVTTVTWRGHRVNLVDTPGHVDFTAEVERALRVLDGAVGIFCATAGVQAQSETVWRQADRYKVPRIAFINKMDRVGADFFAAIESMRARLSANPVCLQLPVGAGDSFEGVIDLLEWKSVRFDEESLGEKLLLGDIDEGLVETARQWRSKLVEAAADCDDEVLELYLSGEEIPAERIRAAIRKGTLARKITPVFCGAALRNKGVQPLLDGVCDYLPSPGDIGTVTGIQPDTGKPVERKLQASERLAALAFKTVATPHGDLVYLRVYSGVLQEGRQAWNSRTGKKNRLQKLYLLHANHRELLKEVEAGNIVAAVGLKDTATGDTLCDPAHRIVLEPPRFPEAVVSMAIEPVSIADREKLEQALEKVQREDPTFHWRVDKETGQILIAGMGELHLENVKDRILREFCVSANVGAPRVSYRQTLLRAAEGSGVFSRQLGGHNQYARVSLRLDPTPETSRPQIESQLKKDVVPLEFHPVIEDAARACLEGGGVLGFALIQMKLLIQDAEFHRGESTPAAYSAATAAAFEEAIEKAGAVILEPVMRFEIQVPEEFYGAVSGDLNKRRAGIREVEAEHGLRVLRGVVPLAEVFGYPNTLRSISQGRGTISLEPESYLPVPEYVAARFRL